MSPLEIEVGPEVKAGDPWEETGESSQSPGS